MCIVASQAGNQNWNPATRAVEFTVAPGSDTVAKAAAAVTLLDLRQPYANAARPVTATTFPAGLALDITYNGGAAAPTKLSAPNPPMRKISATSNIRPLFMPSSLLCRVRFRHNRPKLFAGQRCQAPSEKLYHTTPRCCPEWL